MALFREDRELSVDPRAPERSHLALSRLIPWLRPATTSDPSVDARFYTSRPGQNPLEIRLTSTLFYLTWTLLIFGAAARVFDFSFILAPLVLFIAALAAVVVILAILPLAEVVTRIVRRMGLRAEGVTIQSAVQQAILVLACIEALLDRHWMRWVGLFWLTLVGVEMIARLIEAARPGSEA